MNNADMPAMAIPPVQFTDVDGSRLVATGTNGLTKREHFAGLAMQGLLAHYGTVVNETCAVQFADALLKELEQDG